MTKAELSICLVGAKPEGECTPPRCHIKRLGNKEIRLVCIEECSTEMLNLLERLDEKTVRVLQNICTGVGGCAEVLLVDNKLCCTTRLENMPGLKSLGSVLSNKGVDVSLEKGLVRLCVRLENLDIGKSVELLRNAFLILESVYDTQRRIAEGVAKSITSVAELKTQQTGSMKKREASGGRGQSRGGGAEGSS